MSIEAIAGVASGIAASPVDAAQPVARTSMPAPYAGTSDPARSEVPYQGDIQDVLQAQVNELIGAEKRIGQQGATDPSQSGVSGEPPAPAKTVNEALTQVTPMFEFSVKATLLGSVANQSVSAVTTLAKSQ